ncbi:hypothetical protein ACVWYG_003505 [Pedobacter sp. UYEF25]
MNLIHKQKKMICYKTYLKLTALGMLYLFVSPFQVLGQKIDRKALVNRHNLHITDRNVKGPTQVGNGHFAFGFDITGLQTFNKFNI